MLQFIHVLKLCTKEYKICKIPGPRVLQVQKNLIMFQTFKHYFYSLKFSNQQKRNLADNPIKLDTLLSQPRLGKCIHIRRTKNFIIFAKLVVFATRNFVYLSLPPNDFF